MSNYDDILAELRGRRAAANSSLMQGALDRAIALTDVSHKVLEQLENQRGLLLGHVVEKPLEENDVFKQAVALVNALEELEQPLQAQLQSSVRSARGPAAVAPTGVTETDTSPDFRARLARLQERLRAGDKLLMDDPKVIRAQLEKIQHQKRRAFEAAAAAMHASREADSLLRIVHVLSSYWLAFVLVERIYDTSETNFEESLGNERLGESVRWGVGAILGLLPFVGVALGLLDLVRSVKQARSSRWNSADETLAFLDSYEKALNVWLTQAEQFLGRTEHLLANRRP